VSKRILTEPRSEGTEVLAEADRQLVGRIREALEPARLTAAEQKSFETDLIARLARAPRLHPPWLALASGALGLLLVLSLLVVLTIPTGTQAPAARDGGGFEAQTDRPGRGGSADAVARWMNSLTEPGDQESFVCELDPEYQAIAGLLSQGAPEDQ
jgi:hypothetical protein